MRIKEYEQGEWHVFEFVPELIVVHSGIQGGQATIKGTRVPTSTATFAYTEKRWKDYRITEQQAFAAYCFEAGIEYQKKHLKINKSVNESWRKFNEKHYPHKGD